MAGKVEGDEAVRSGKVFIGQDMSEEKGAAGVGMEEEDVGFVCRGVSSRDGVDDTVRGLQQLFLHVGSSIQSLLELWVWNSWISFNKT